MYLLFAEYFYLDSLYSGPIGSISSDLYKITGGFLLAPVVDLHLVIDIIWTTKNELYSWPTNLEVYARISSFNNTMDVILKVCSLGSLKVVVGRRSTKIPIDHILSVWLAMINLFELGEAAMIDSF
jgi:hypothetical protein